MTFTKWRTQKKWSQFKAAQALQVHRITYIMWEKGRIMPKPESLKRIFFVTQGRVTLKDIYENYKPKEKPNVKIHEPKKPDGTGNFYTA